jgi:hypothetical protein
MLHRQNLSASQSKRQVHCIVDGMDILILLYLKISRSAGVLLPFLQVLVPGSAEGHTSVCILERFYTTGPLDMSRPKANRKGSPFLTEL